MAAAATTGTTPFFGCKISLISKSEIRYEGILYTIDPKESTIALAKVRSFGSEDRPVERHVPPRDDIFEFIIFRASDIKDLIVDDPPQPTLTDPAIIQAQHSTSTSFPAAFSQHSAGGGVPTGPNAGHGHGQPPQPQQVQQQQTPLQQLQQQAAAAAAKQNSASIVKQHSGGDASESSKPTATKTSSSNVISGQAFAKVAAGGQKNQNQNQQNQQQQQATNSGTNRQPGMQFSGGNKQQPGGQVKSEGTGQQAGGLRLSQQGPGGQREGGGGSNGYMPRLPRQNNQNRENGDRTGNQNFQQQHRNGPQQGGGFRSYNANRFTPRHEGQQGGFGGGRGGFRRGGGFTGGANMGHRNFISRGPMSLGGGVGGPNAGGPKFPPLPDGDFDFEKAQADFKILEEKLSALKLNGAAAAAIGDGGDGTSGVEIPEIPGIPASAIAVAALEAEEETVKEPCYNKTKSFFDSISCEALEREKGTNQRVDWKAERKLNRETFGVVSARRPTFYRTNNRGGFGGGQGYHGGRGGYHQQRGAHHHYSQNRGPMNRVQNRSSSNGGGAPGSTPNTSRTSTGPKTPNGTAAPAAAASASTPIATKN